MCLFPLPNQIHGLDDSDHSVRVRNWRADVKIAQKQVDDTRKKVIDARNEYERLETASQQAIESAAVAEKEHETALEARQLAAEALQNHTPDHLSQILRSAQDIRTEAERTKLRAESDIVTGGEKLKVLEDRKNELTRSVERGTKGISFLLNFMLNYICSNPFVKVMSWIIHNW